MLNVKQKEIGTRGTLARKIFSMCYLVAMALPQFAIAKGPCPLRHGQPPKYVGIYDGPPEELASLEAELTGPNSGFFELGYIYDAGRQVHFRCFYADRFMFDIKSIKRIERCDFNVNVRRHTKLRCK
ncbi:STY0301 family protein [Massilia sp. TS11]|uniref:STY0301 family protein n=1 Tax=Massilia sp. TS11 TaxID=2908003 RepID=UPI001EDB86FE|nr:STY0301 family protein [Massilia sp. TS11]MCG2583517.1 hypothetical protein [Massilia sp. TS11]